MALVNSLMAFEASFPELSVSNTEIIAAFPLSSNNCLSGLISLFDLSCATTFCNATCVSASSHNTFTSSRSLSNSTESKTSILALSKLIFLALFFRFFLLTGNERNWLSKSVLSANLSQAESTPLSIQSSLRLSSTSLYSSFQSSFFNCLLMSKTARRNALDSDSSSSTSSTEGSQSIGL